MILQTKNRPVLRRPRALPAAQVLCICQLLTVTRVIDMEPWEVLVALHGAEMKDLCVKKHEKLDLTAQRKV